MIDDFALRMLVHFQNLILNVSWSVKLAYSRAILIYFTYIFLINLLLHDYLYVISWSYFHTSDIIYPSFIKYDIFIYSIDLVLSRSKVYNW